MAITVKWVGDSKSAEDAADAVAEGVAKTKAEMRALVAENQRLERVSKEVWNKSQTDIERYQKKIEDVKAAAARGIIQPDVEKRNLEFLRGEIEKINLAKISEEMAAVNKETEAYKTKAASVFEATRTHAERYRTKLAELKDLVARGLIDPETEKRRIKQLDDELAKLENRRPFDPSVALGAARLAGSLALVAGAAKTVHDGLRLANEEAEKFANRREAGAGARGELAQVTTGKEDFRELLRRSDVLLSRGAVPDAATASNVVAAIRSGNLDRDFGTFVELGRSKLVNDLEGLAKAIDGIKGNLPEAGSTEQIVSRALVAGSVAPGKLNEVLTYIARVSKQGSAIGLAPSEIFAGQAVSAKLAVSNEVGRTEFEAFLRAADKAKIKGTLSQIVEQFQSRVTQMGGEFEAFNGIGDASAIAGFRSQVRGRQLVRDLLAQEGDIVSGRAFRNRLEILGENPQTSVDQSVTTATGSREVAMDNKARIRQLVNTYQNLGQTLMTQQGTPDIVRGMVGAYQSWLNAYGAITGGAPLSAMRSLLDRGKIQREIANTTDPEQLATLKEMTRVLDMLSKILSGQEKQSRAPVVPVPEAP